MRWRLTLASITVDTAADDCTSACLYEEVIDAHPPAAMKGAAAVVPPGERCTLPIRGDGLCGVDQTEVNEGVPGVALPRGDMRRANQCGWVPHVGIGRGHIEITAQE